MKWDQDLQRLWWFALVALGANVGATIGMAWKHEWKIVPVCVIWVVTVLVWMQVIRKVQSERHREREAMRDLWKKIREQDDAMASLKQGDFRSWIRPN